MSVIGGTGQLPTSTPAPTTQAAPPPIVQRVNIPGEPGEPGTNAYTQTSASFVMPPSDDTTTVPVSVLDSIWMGVDQPLFVENAGMMKVTAISSQTLILIVNPGVPGNLTPGLTVPTESKISPGSVGTGGGNGYTPTTPSNWSPWTSTPSTITQALDSLAAQTITFISEISTLTGNISTLTGAISTINTTLSNVYNFTPATSGNWTIVPTTIQEGLNYLAAGESISFEPVNIDYTPGVPGNWSIVPTTLQGALDNIASGNSFASISTNLAYSPTTSADWPISVPTTVQQALDYIAIGNGYTNSSKSPTLLYTPTTSGDWLVQPTTVQMALDYIAEGNSFASSATVLTYTPSASNNWVFNGSPPTLVQAALDDLANNPVGTSIVFYPGGSSTSPNTVITESELNTISGLPTGPLKIWIDLNAYSNTYALAGPLTLNGAYGIFEMAGVMIGAIPQLTTNYAITIPNYYEIVIRDIQLIASADPCLTGPTSIRLVGQGAMNGFNSPVLITSAISYTLNMRDSSALYYADIEVVSGATFYFNMYEQSVTNSLYHPCFTIDAGGHMYISLYDNADLVTGAVTLPVAGTLTVYVYSPSATFDPALLTDPNTTVMFMYMAGQYAPSTPADWAGTPATLELQDAIDRLATAVSGLLGTPIP